MITSAMIKSIKDRKKLLERDQRNFPLNEGLVGLITVFGWSGLTLVSGIAVNFRAVHDGAEQDGIHHACTYQGRIS